MIAASTSTSVLWWYVLTVVHGEPVATRLCITAYGRSQSIGSRVLPAESMAMFRKISRIRCLPSESSLVSARTPPGSCMTDFCQGVKRSLPIISA
ncbi:hypothetical protein GCM10020000_45190 [Streptomyces olivoverticillatus]